MAPHERFRFREPEDLREKARSLGIELPFAPDAGILASPRDAAGRRFPNRLAVLPMEGADAADDGGPGPLTERRYLRFARGGAGLIWSEALAVRPDGRSNPRQLTISEKNVSRFARLVDLIRSAARESAGPAAPSPWVVAQLTHSGRFARPSGSPAPIIARHSPVLDPLRGVTPDRPVIDDAGLDRLRDDFLRAARLAADAGFDAVDVKACHGYLVSELLASRSRRDSRYGGSFENRTRFLRETAAAIRAERPRLPLTARLSAADMVPFPDGFGMSEESPGEPDLSEPIALAAALRRSVGLPVLSYSIGVPAWKPHFGRSFDQPVPGGAIPDEHPLEGVARHLRVASALQAALPDVAVVAAGLSWLRQFFPAVAGGLVAAGGAAFAGMGRGALADPDFAREIVERGRLEPRKLCTTCSLCSKLLRDGGPVGCPARDAEAYS